MTVKGVWGVVLILIGVAIVFSGFSQLSDIRAIDEFFYSLKNFFRIYSNPYEKLYEKSLFNARLDGFFKIVFGICLSVLGSYMVKDSEPCQQKYHKNYRDSIDLPDNDEWRMK